jgi:CubicO group peptidase (beta-lactamase class C family)
MMHTIKEIENSLMPAIGIEGSSIKKAHIIEQMQHYGVPGCSIAVIDEGKIAWAKAYGNAKKGIPLTTESLFQTGSFSKSISALASLMLVHEGKLHLNKDINEQLRSWKFPETPYTLLSKVSLQHLLSHTSGCNIIAFDGYPHLSPLPSLKEILEGNTPAKNPPIRISAIPGSKISYSGGAYVVVQQLIEDATGLPFDSFIESRILKRLKMENSTFSDPIKNWASGHIDVDRILEGEFRRYPEKAASGLWSTPCDFSKFLIHLQNALLEKSHDPLIPKTLLDLMITPSIFPFGLGLVIDGEKENFEINHRGRTCGYTCGFVLFPYLKKGAVIMTNADNANLLISEIFRSIANVYNWPSQKIQIKQKTELKENILDAYLGKYVLHDRTSAATVFKENHSLFIKAESGTIYQLHAETTHRFFITENGFIITFLEKHGEMHELILTMQRGVEKRFQRISLYPEL